MATPLTVILGGDTLAFEVCKALVDTGAEVVVLWDRTGDVPAHVVRLGARFSARHGDESGALVEAGILDAAVAMALTEDDHANLQFALTARDLNPRVRIVMRIFNRTLGRKIEQNLSDCSVVSLSAQAASTYAGAAVDRDCFYGVQFPDIDGPLVGFMNRDAASAGVTGANAEEAERKLGARVLACNGALQYDRARPFSAEDELTLFARVEPRETGLARRSAATLAAFGRAVRNLRRSVARPDPVVRSTALAALGFFVAAVLYFCWTQRLGGLTSAYYVLSAMTTNGLGDIAPAVADLRGQAVAMVLMLAGITFTGIFIAVLSSRFAQAQYVATQGLRPVSRSGHIVVCGAGHVGARVVDQLVALGRSVVVVETEPKAETIARSRAGDFQLLTGDASKDATLDLCNITEATALLALTNSDTMNLEIALGVRARNKDCHLVMRVQHSAFEASVRRNFGFERVFGTAALAAPVFVGLAHGPGIRGFVTIGAEDCAVIESDGRPPAARYGGDPGWIPLAVWREGSVVPLVDFEDARLGERVLSLADVPLAVL
jgi:Trk K+ transport system NAD-binding subunit